jgi:hypothetical protein
MPHVSNMLIWHRSTGILIWDASFTAASWGFFPRTKTTAGRSSIWAVLTIWMFVSPVRSRDPGRAKASTSLMRSAP